MANYNTASESAFTPGRLRKIKIRRMLISLIMLAFGCLLLFRPAGSMLFVARAIGVGIILSGLVILSGYFTKSSILPGASMLGGIVLAAFGVFLLSKPTFLIDFIPVIAGIVVAADGVMNLLETLRLRKYQNGLTGALILPILSIVLGCILIFRPFGVVKIIVRLIGIVLVYNAVTDFIVAARIDPAKPTKSAAGATVFDAENVREER